MTHPAARMSLFETTARTVLYTSPMIVMMSSFFALLVIPLAVWSVGSRQWRSLKKYVCVFWLVQVVYVLLWSNADGLILTSGAGLIALWVHLHRDIGSTEDVITIDVEFDEDSTPMSLPLRTYHHGSEITAFVGLVAISCILLAPLIIGIETKRYLAEVVVCYIAASILQGMKIMFERSRQRQVAR